ncbi:MAG: carbonic anhydrase [Dongiaceae bacterium]
MILAGGATTLACPICRAVADEQKAGAHGATHWAYDGEAGPKNWGELSADFKVCSLGMEQTPIDLKGTVRAETGLVEPAFKQMPLTILNNGHTVQVNCASGSRTLISGLPFELAQFHFHHPSEHLLSGRAFELELHFVHKSSEGQLAVLGVFIREGQENAALAPIWSAMPREVGEPQQIDALVDPAALLPAERKYFRYKGSLTTPPCSEGVLWTVFKDPIEASSGQIRQFAELFPANARPVQSLNSRFLLESM